MDLQQKYSVYEIPLYGAFCSVIYMHLPQIAEYVFGITYNLQMKLSNDPTDLMFK